MSEGVEGGPVTSQSFWEKRWHLIADAIVESGWCPEIDKTEYEKIKWELSRKIPLPLAAAYAFSICKQLARVPSACEVNPW